MAKQKNKARQPKLSYNDLRRGVLYTGYYDSILYRLGPAGLETYDKEEGIWQNVDASFLYGNKDLIFREYVRPKDKDAVSNNKKGRREDLPSNKAIAI